MNAHHFDGLLIGWAKSCGNPFPKTRSQYLRMEVAPSRSMSSKDHRTKVRVLRIGTSSREHHHSCEWLTEYVLALRFSLHPIHRMRNNYVFRDNIGT